MVKQYLKVMREEQANALVQPTQAQPVFFSKLERVCRHITSKMKNPTVKETFLFALARDQAFFKILFFAADRASDLGRCKAEELAWLPGEAGIRFNHTFGKTLRDGSANAFPVLAGKNNSTCPVQGLRVYIRVAQALKIRLNKGYLFRTVDKSHRVMNEPFLYDAAQSRFKMYLSEMGEYEGDTLHGVRTASAITMALGGADSSSLMTHVGVGWRNKSTAERYLRLDRVYHEKSPAAILQEEVTRSSAKANSTTQANAVRDRLDPEAFYEGRNRGHERQLRYRIRLLGHSRRNNTDPDVAVCEAIQDGDTIRVVHNVAPLKDGFSGLISKPRKMRQRKQSASVPRRGNSFDISYLSVNEVVTVNVKVLSIDKSDELEKSDVTDVAALVRELRELKKQVGALKSGRAADDIKEELVQYASRPEAALDAHRALALVEALVTQARRKDTPKPRTPPEIHGGAEGTRAVTHKLRCGTTDVCGDATRTTLRLTTYTCEEGLNFADQFIEHVGLDQQQLSTQPRAPAQAEDPGELAAVSSTTSALRAMQGEEGGGPKAKFQEFRNSLVTNNWGTYFKGEKIKSTRPIRLALDDVAERARFGHDYLVITGAPPGREPLNKPEERRTEWPMFKELVHANYQNATFQHLVKGFSVQDRIKTKNIARLKAENLEVLMRIRTEWPAILNFDFYRALQKFRAAKHRRICHGRCFEIDTPITGSGSVPELEDPPSSRKSVSDLGQTVTRTDADPLTISLISFFTMWFTLNRPLHVTDEVWNMLPTIRTEGEELGRTAQCVQGSLSVGGGEPWAGGASTLRKPLKQETTNHRNRVMSYDYLKARYPNLALSIHVM
ncbi:hypothetical protein Bbelb_343830 [Branchiostoma belcheri]|nr:hypothetical protein Bbelb_343830 [Branchiostoma belcheri]